MKEGAATSIINVEYTKGKCVLEGDKYLLTGNGEDVMYYVVKVIDSGDTTATIEIAKSNVMGDA
jgi:hypothetical protein